MSVPKSVVKFDKNGVVYTSSVDRANYTMKELSRAALRDVGKFVCREFRKPTIQRLGVKGQRRTLHTVLCNA